MAKNPLGKVVLLKKRPLTVIGVLKKDDNQFEAPSDSLQIYTPYTTLMSQISGNKIHQQYHGES